MFTTTRTCRQAWIVVVHLNKVVLDLDVTADGISSHLRILDDLNKKKSFIRLAATRLINVNEAHLVSTHSPAAGHIRRARLNLL